MILGSLDGLDSLDSLDFLEGFIAALFPKQGCACSSGDRWRR